MKGTEARSVAENRRKLPTQNLCALSHHILYEAMFGGYCVSAFEMYSYLVSCIGAAFNRVANRGEAMSYSRRTGPDERSKVNAQMLMTR